MTQQAYIAFVKLNLADQMRSLQKWNGKKWNPKRFEDFSNALRNADKKHGTLLKDIRRPTNKLSKLPRLITI